MKLYYSNESKNIGRFLDLLLVTLAGGLIFSYFLKEPDEGYISKGVLKLDNYNKKGSIVYLLNKNDGEIKKIKFIDENTNIRYFKLGYVKRDDIFKDFRNSMKLENIIVNSNTNLICKSKSNCPYFLRKYDYLPNFQEDLKEIYLKTRNLHK